MGRLTNKPTIKIDGLDFPIFTECKKGKKYYCFVEQLQRCKREIDAMLSHYNKVFILRFDIHVHAYSPTNEQMTQFLRSYIPRIERYYKTKNVGSAWCREVERAKKQHYHVAIMVDGSNATRVSGKLLEMANEVASIQDLHIGYCDNASYLIKRNDLAKGNYKNYEGVFYRLSYLTKERGKKIKAERANSFQTSRIKPRLNEHGEVFSHKDDYKHYLKNKATSKTKTVDKPIQQMTDAERQLPLFV